MLFLRAEAERWVKESALLRLEAVLNRKAVGQVMGNLGRSGYGRPATIPSSAQGLFLQEWHSVSDPALEDIGIQDVRGG